MPLNDNIKAVLLDMDGVLYHGDTALPGALAFMQQLSAIPHAFITNNPIRLPEQVADLLSVQGFARPSSQQIITSGMATALYLHEIQPGFRYFAVGAEGLHKALKRFGQPSTGGADFVVVGEGEGLDYRQLTIGINLILKHGAQLISTNPDDTVDATINGEHIILPGGGSLVAPFVHATGRKPLTIGKPEPQLYRMALQSLQVAASECLMIGDRPDTDITGASRLGMKTALVRTGRFAPGAALPADCPVPDYDTNDLPTLGRQLGLID